MAEHDDFDALVFRWQWIAPEAHKMTEWEGMCLRYATPRKALSVAPLLRPYPTIFIPSNAHAQHIIAWVTQPERPKGAKDEVKPARRATN